METNQSTTLEKDSFFGAFKPDLSKAMYELDLDPTHLQFEIISNILQQKDIFFMENLYNFQNYPFFLSILELIDKNSPHCQALIFSPTNTLIPVFNYIISQFNKYLQISVCICSGEKDFSSLAKTIEKGPNIVIGSIEKFHELTMKGHLKCEHIKICLLNEVNQIVKSESKEKVLDILKKTPQQTQIIACSDFLTPEIDAFLKEIINDPIFLSEKQEDPVELKHYYVEVQKEEKFELLCDLFHSLDNMRGLINCKDDETAQELEEQLKEKNFSAKRIRSNMTKAEVEAIQQDFSLGNFSILLSPKILYTFPLSIKTFIINYDIPNKYDYLARLSKLTNQDKVAGVVNFVTKEELSLIKEIEYHFMITINELPADLNNL